MHVAALRSYRSDQSGRSFICCDVTEWNICSVKCERGFESSGEQFKIQSGNIFPPFSFQCKCGPVIPQVNQMDEQNVRRCHPPTHPPTQTHTLTWCWRCFGGGVMAQSLWLLCPSIRPADTQEEWIIYDHFSSGSSDRCDSWAPNSLNLVICHSGEKLNRGREFKHFPLVLPSVTTRTIWQQILDSNKMTPRSTRQTYMFPLCGWFRSDPKLLYTASRMIHHNSSSHESFLCVTERQAGHKKPGPD